MADEAPRPRIVVVGAGFGGLEAARPFAYRHHGDLATTGRRSDA